VAVARTRIAIGFKTFVDIFAKVAVTFKAGVTDAAIAFRAGGITSAGGIDVTEARFKARIARVAVDTISVVTGFTSAGIRADGVVTIGKLMTIVVFGTEAFVDVFAVETISSESTSAFTIVRTLSIDTIGVLMTFVSSERTFIDIDTTKTISFVTGFTDTDIRTVGVLTVCID